MIFEVLDHFLGATKRTRPAESIFAIRFERKLLFLEQILIQSIDLLAAAAAEAAAAAVAAAAAAAAAARHHPHKYMLRPKKDTGGGKENSTC